jgi:hypothetical protein
LYQNTANYRSVLHKCKPGLDSPDSFVCQAEALKSTQENAATFGVLAAGWTLFGQSRIRRAEVTFV